MTAAPDRADARPGGSAPRPLAFRHPPDLARLPLVPNLRATSVLEGLRAALAVALPVMADQWVRSPLLILLALGALTTCFCDQAGPMRRRVSVLLAYTVLGTAMFVGFGMLRWVGLWVAVPVAGLAIFCNGLARVWGQASLVAGNILTVVVVLALDEPLPPAEAGPVAAAFALGCLWALLLAVVIFRIHPYGPARRAIAQAWRTLAALTADLRAVLHQTEITPAEWDRLARQRRRAARDALEQARTVVRDTLRARGPGSLRAAQTLFRLEAAEQIFGAFIALSDVLERERDPVQRRAADQALRLVRPMLVVLAQAGLADAKLPSGRLERALAAIEALTRPWPALYPPMHQIAERLRIAATLSAPDGFLPGTEAAPRPPGWRERVVTPVLANLSWNSAMLRHALRGAVVAVPALVVTLYWYSEYTHWLTISLVLTMQPFFALTWQRALERIGGTLLGGLIAAAIAMVCTTPLSIALAMFPLAVIAFTLRQVSFGTFIMCLTPLVVLLVELIEPGNSELTIALMRALYTVCGGALAVLGCLLLWPSWEPDRLRQTLRAAILAHADYAQAVLSAAPGEETGTLVASRRAAGVASNNLEAALNRALNEPRLGRQSAPAMLGAATVVDAALRRMAGRLVALRLDPAPRGAMPAAKWAAWRDWVVAALRGLAAEPPAQLAPRPSGEPVQALGRLARQVELMDGVLRRAE